MVMNHLLDGMILEVGHDPFRLQETLGTGGWFGMVRTAGGSPAGAKMSPRLPFKRLRKTWKNNPYPTRMVDFICRSIQIFP